MLESDRQDFTPDWFSTPADSLLSLMNRRGITVDVVAQALDGGLDTIRGLMTGARAIDGVLASSLSEVVGGSSAFWLKRQANYERALDLAVDRVSSELDEWLERVPAPGAKPRGKLSGAQKLKETRKRLSFYGVNSLRSWNERYGKMRGVTQFRTSQAFASTDGAVSLWLRQGELDATLRKTKQWNPDKLRASLGEILKLSKIHQPNRFLPKLIALGAEAGVAIVVVRAAKGCRASGATRLLTPDKAMVLLSFRHLSDDHFWFTVLHEFGHLLLHGAETFVDVGDNYSDSRDPAEGDIVFDRREQEANDFARSCIIPAEYWERFVDLRCDKNSILRFSVALGIAPGLIVGQLQHRGVIPRERLNFLKRRWSWDDVEAALS